jgi:hypothetical protein
LARIGGAAYRCSEFEKTICTSAVKYVRLAAEQLVGILCVLYVKDELRTRVTTPEVGRT